MEIKSESLEAVMERLDGMDAVLSRLIFGDKTIREDVFRLKQLQREAKSGGILMNGTTPGTTGDFLMEKMAVLAVLNRWKVSAAVQKKEKAKQDCERIIRFINAVCPNS